MFSPPPYKDKRYVMEKHICNVLREICRRWHFFGDWILSLTLIGSSLWTTRIKSAGEAMAKGNSGRPLAGLFFGFYCCLHTLPWNSSRHFGNGYPWSYLLFHYSADRKEILKPGAQSRCQSTLCTLYHHFPHSSSSQIYVPTSAQL